MRTKMLGGFLAAERAAEADGRSPVDAILDAVRHHLGLEIAFASRYVGGRRVFTHISTDLPLPIGPGDGDPVEESYCWNILQGRLPELIRDPADHPFAMAMPVTHAFPVGCHLNVPLRLGDGSVYGSFCCLSRTPDRSMTERDLSTLRAFADLAVVQIEGELAATQAQAASVQRIETAIADQQPAVALQPIHRLEDGRPVGVEALARFAGARPPAEWFAEAAAVGLSVELELAAVRAALAVLPLVPAPHYLAVNVSPRLILSGLLEAALGEALGSGRLVVEITEHEAVEDYRALRSALAPICDHVRLAVDDVGAGYAGLRHILDIGPDILKLDMSLTRDVDRDPARRALIGAMVTFAGSIGCTIIAEGIEREGERRLLSELGIPFGQGWHFSRAMPPVAAQQLLIGAVSKALFPQPIAAPRRRRAASR